MKLRSILFSFIALAATGSSYAYQSETFAWNDQLILKGEFIDISHRASAPIPMDATVSNNAIKLDFYAPVGEVFITVSGTTRTAYSTSLNVTTIGQQTSLSLENLAPGSYLLEFRDSKGGYVYGEFVIN